MEANAAKAVKVPSEAIELYNLFIHNVITRRAVFDADADTLPGFTRPKRFVF